MLALELVRPAGVLISELHVDSPLQTVGIRAGDIILSVDGHEVFDLQGLRFRFVTRPIGETVNLKIVRRGRDFLAKVELVAPPERPSRDIRNITGDNPLSGSVVGNLSPAFSEELNIDATRSGVIVLKVGRGYAARLGLRAGDIVTKCARAPSFSDAMSQFLYRDCSLVMPITAVIRP